MSNPSDVRVSVEALWLPSSGLDPATYEDVYRWSGSPDGGPAPDLPLRLALSDATSVSRASQLWSGLLVDGFVSDGETTAEAIVRNASVRSAVFVAQSTVSGIAADGRVGAGLFGLEVHADGTATGVAAGAYTMVHIRPGARLDVRHASGTDELRAVGEVREDQLREWRLEWQPGDVLLMCSRGVPATMLSKSASEQWWQDSLPSFQGRVRRERSQLQAGEGRSTGSATVLRLRLGAH